MTHALRLLPLLALSALVACGPKDADGDGVNELVDCDDGNAAVFEGAVDICDGLDNDCDGLVDEDPEADGIVAYDDVDLDTYGDPLTARFVCELGEGLVAVAGDCDDGNGQVNPGTAETCNGVDDDCDGLVDDDPADGTLQYRDYDGDSFGDPDAAMSSCDGLQDGYVTNDDDCNDGAPNAFPGGTEVCDLVDNDCDGTVDGANAIDPGDYWEDQDGDGFGNNDVFVLDGCPPALGWVDAPGDCDDANPDVFPGGYDEWYDGVDGNCDGFDDYDQDFDGDPPPEYGGTDCDDLDPWVSGVQLENPLDGIDNDCDGLYDFDDDTTFTPVSLGDDDAASISFGVNPGFPFCGSTWTSMYVGSNGFITFAASSTDLSESDTEMSDDGPIIAGLWDDLNPSSMGTVYVAENEFAVGVYFDGVPEYGSGEPPNDFSYTLYSTGRIGLVYGEIDSTDHIAGWHCGGMTSTTNIDWTEAAADYPAPDGLGLGKGTEGFLYEQFTSGSDLAFNSFLLCGQTDGVDADGDGWAARCGDLDDANASVHP